jgi:hypothetical protein
VATSPKLQSTARASPQPKTTGEVTLANHVQLLVEGKPVLFRANHTYTLGEGAGELPPSILTRQPLLDLDHPAHVESRAELAEIDQKAQRNDQLARQRSVVAAQGAGTPPTGWRRHGIV